MFRWVAVANLKELRRYPVRFEGQALRVPRSLKLSGVNTQPRLWLRIRRIKLSSVLFACFPIVFLKDTCICISFKNIPQIRGRSLKSERQASQHYSGRICWPWRQGTDYDLAGRGGGRRVSGQGHPRVDLPRNRTVKCNGEI